MSFDLTLFPREGQSLDREPFFAYFEGRGNFERTDDRLGYSNGNTGVYFTLHFAERRGVEPDNPNEAGGPDTWIEFNMNFMRPAFFALEAAPILAAIAGRFSLLADDPQADGAGRGEFDADAFVRSWTRSNRWACGAIGQLGTGPRLSLPRTVNEAFWHWNHTREGLSEDLLDDLIGAFVPLVRYYREAGQARTFCIFPNLIPTVVPRVDRVLVLRNELPEPFAAESNQTPGWVTWDELVAVMPGYDMRSSVVGEELSYLILFREEGYESPETVPEALARWVIGLPDWPGRPDQISPDTILDAENRSSHVD